MRCSVDNKTLEQLRTHFPDVRLIHRPGRHMLHLVDQRFPTLTHCSQLSVDDCLDSEELDIRGRLFCRLCERWGDALVARARQMSIVTAKIEQGKREILADIANGQVPADVRNFSHLHDFVDANEYGGVTDPTEAAAVQEELNQWLITGRA